MDGLIKGLINVALGHGENEDESLNSQSRDERSRSTWAQVVSGDQDDEEQHRDRKHENHRNQSNHEEEKLGRNDEWLVAGSRPSKQPQKFYLEEAKGRVDYQGYIFPRRRGQTPDSETQLLTILFEWNGVLKSVSSTLVGVSPEFEVALYTLCFFVGQEDNYIQLGPYPVNVKCYRLGNKIGFHALGQPEETGRTVSAGGGAAAAYGASHMGHGNQTGHGGQAAPYMQGGGHAAPYMQGGGGYGHGGKQGKFGKHDKQGKFVKHGGGVGKFKKWK